MSHYNLKIPNIPKLPCYTNKSASQEEFENLLRARNVLTNFSEFLSKILREK
jgi:hypothetical protein